MKVGIQLFSVRENMKIDPLGTIRKVVETGYSNLEVANHNARNDIGVGFGVAAKEVRKLLDETGASIVSAHISPMEPDNLDAILEYHKEIGTRFMSNPMPFYRNMEEVKQKVEWLNRTGKKCAEWGIQLMYHNHFHEFQRFDGVEIYDYLMRETDPELVKIELDSYWSTRGQQSPVELLKKYGKRVCALHQKDFPKGFEAERDLLQVVQENNTYVDMEYFHTHANPETFTEIGTGIIDIQTIIDTANENCAVEYILLEQDHTSLGELESIKISMDSFKKFHGVEW